MLLRRRRSYKGISAFVTLALLGICFLVSGVLAVTNITINTGSGLSVGSGATTATSCDSEVVISTQNSIDATVGIYKLSTISISDIDGSYSACANKVMQLAVSINGVAYQASWSIVSSALNNTYVFAQATKSANFGTIYYATTAFTAVDPATLGTFAITIN